MSHYFVSKSSAFSEPHESLCNLLQPIPTTHLFDTHCSYSRMSQMFNVLCKLLYFNALERFRPQLKQRMLPESRRTACAEMAREQCRTTIFHQESPWKLITSEGFFFVRARSRERFALGLQAVQFEELVEFVVICDMDG